MNEKINHFILILLKLQLKAQLMCTQMKDLKNQQHCMSMDESTQQSSDHLMLQQKAQPTPNCAADVDTVKRRFTMDWMTMKDLDDDERLEAVTLGS